MRPVLHTTVKILLAAALLVSCGKKDPERTDGGRIPISFTAENNWGDTRASVVSSFADGDKLAVYSYNTSDIIQNPQLFMNGVLIGKTASGWDYDNVGDTRYWPEGFNNRLSFLACYPAEDPAVIITTDGANGNIILEYTREAGTEAAVDVMAGYVPSISKTDDGKVSLPMTHLLTNWQISFWDKTFTSGMRGNRVRVKSLTITCNSNAKATVTYNMTSESAVGSYTEPDNVTLTFGEGANAISDDSLTDQEDDAEIFRNDNTLMIPGDYTSVTVTAVLEIYASVYVSNNNTGDLEVDGSTDGTGSGAVPGTGSPADGVYLWETAPFTEITLVKNLDNITGVEGGTSVKFKFSYAYGDVNMSASVETESSGSDAGSYLRP